MKTDLLNDTQADDVLSFWLDAGPSMWFAKDADFDRRFRNRFLIAHEAASRSELQGWAATAEGALALLLLLDQFPRNAFRGTPRMYATDALARRGASAAITAGHDQAVTPLLRTFFYLPFGHSEDLADQRRSVQLCQPLDAPAPAHSRRHHDIVQRFGRFPHRNTILGRASRAEELQYLAEGGYAG